MLQCLLGIYMLFVVQYSKSICWCLMVCITPSINQFGKDTFHQASGGFQGPGLKEEKNYVTHKVRSFSRTSLFTGDNNLHNICAVGLKSGFFFCSEAIVTLTRGCRGKN